MGIPCQQGCPGARACGGNPDIVRRNRTPIASQGVNHLSEYFGSLPVDWQRFHNWQSEKLVQIFEILLKPRPLSENGVQFANNGHWDADPLGAIQHFGYFWLRRA
jgi:hypothetical protein